MKKLTAIYKLGFPLLVFAAVIAEFTQLEHTAFRIINFFSYFTIESNIFASIILLISGVFVLRGKSSQTFSYIRGAATLFMVITGVVYTLLLADSGHSSWMNTVLHYAFPIVMFVDWLLDRARPIDLLKSLWWLAFPIIFLVYSLVRGAIVHWYPYPFLDVTKHGYGKVALTSCFIAAAGVFLTVLLGLYTKLGSAVMTRKH